MTSKLEQQLVRKLGPYIPAPLSWNAANDPEIALYWCIAVLPIFSTILVCFMATYSLTTLPNAT